MLKVIRQPNGLYGIVDTNRLDTVIDEVTGKTETRPHQIAFSCTRANCETWVKAFAPYATRAAIANATGR